MRILIFFCTLLLIFSGCLSQTTTTQQETRQERENLLESYGELRQEQDKQPHEFAVRDQLIGKWQLVSLTFEEGDIPQQELSIKVSLAASARQNLTIEFFKEYARYGYRGQTGSMRVGGNYDIRSFLNADKLYPVINFTRRQGEPVPRFLFGEAASRTETDATFSRELAPGIVVSFSQDDSGTDDLLHLTRYGRMELTLDGWAQTGHIHCFFRKIK